MKIFGKSVIFKYLQHFAEAFSQNILIQIAAIDPENFSFIRGYQLPGKGAGFIKKDKIQMNLVFLF